MSFTHGLVTDLGTGAVRVGGVGQTENGGNVKLNGRREKISDAEVRPNIDISLNTNRNNYQTPSSDTDNLTISAHAKDPNLTISAHAKDPNLTISIYPHQGSVSVGISRQ